MQAPRGSASEAATAARSRISGRFSGQTAARVELRTCVGCGEQGEASRLVRLVLAGEGAPIEAEAEAAPATAESASKAAATVVVDAKGGRFGRGAHVHPLRACLERAQKGLSRSFRCKVTVQPAELAEAIQVAYARRIVGLVGGGVRAGLVVIGTDAVVESIRANRAMLVLVAADAAAASQRGEIAGAIGAGKALVLWDRARLAAALGRASSMAREGVAVASVLDPRLARAVRESWVAMNVTSEVGRIVEGSESA
ncbi:MAG: YlxR family protein [Myxococcales bacterium]|nr:YlxR family protein [Myxococcales bacterium]